MHWKHGFHKSEEEDEKGGRGDEAKFDNEISESYGSRFQAVLPVLNLRVKEDLKVVLNGHKIIANIGYVFCLNRGLETEVNLEFDGSKDGSSIVSTGMVASNWYNPNCTLTVNGGTYEGSHVFMWYAPNGSNVFSKSTISITNATITATVAGVWASNGTHKSLSVTGTTINSNGTGIYVATVLKTTITDTHVTATNSGIEIKAGEATINNSEIAGSFLKSSGKLNGNGTGDGKAALNINNAYNTTTGTTVTKVTVDKDTKITSGSKLVVQLTVGTNEAETENFAGDVSFTANNGITSNQISVVKKSVAGTDSKKITIGTSAVIIQEKVDSEVKIEAGTQLVIDGAVTASGENAKIVINEGATLVVNESYSGPIEIVSKDGKKQSVSVTDLVGKFTVEKGSVKFNGDITSGTITLEDGDVLVLNANVIDHLKVTVASGTATIKVPGNVTVNNLDIETIPMEVTGTLAVTGTLTSAGKITGNGSIDLIGAGNITTTADVSVTVYQASPISVDDFDKFKAAINAGYRTITFTKDITFIEAYDIPEGTIINLDGHKLIISKEVSLVKSKIIANNFTDNNECVLIETTGTLTIDTSDVLANVITAGNGSAVVTKAKSQTISGQSIDNTAVGYGNTLVLDGVTIEKGNSVVAYGNLVVKGNTKIVNGAALAVAKTGTATVEGTLNNAGNVAVVGKMIVNGIVNIAGSTNNNAIFAVSGDFDEENFGVKITKDAVFNVVKANGTTYENGLYSDSYYGFIVEGTLNMNGTFGGKFADNGIVKINGIGDAEIMIFDGVSLDIVSITGTVVVTDNGVAADAASGINGASSVDGNKITIANLKGVKISEEVNSAVSKDGKSKFFYADMTVGGSITSAVKDGKGILTVEASTAAAIGTGMSKRSAQIYISETLVVGEKDELRINSGKVVIDGQVGATADGSKISVNGADVVVNGCITTGLKGDTTITITSGTVNAAYYKITDSDLKETGYYTTFDAAIAKIAEADGKEIIVSGKVSAGADAEIKSGETVTINAGAELTIKKDKTVTAKDGSTVTNGAVIDVKGTFVIENYASSFTGTEPAADVKSVADPAVTYTSLAGAIASGATDITLGRNVTVDSDLTIPAGVVVKSDRFGFIVNVEKTLTVEGGVELTGSSNTITLKDATGKTTADLTVTGYVMTKAEPFACDDTNRIVDGAFFTKKVNGINMNFISSVEYAAENVDKSVTSIIIKGAVSAGDVVFTTPEKSTLVIAIEGEKSILTVSSLKLVGATLTTKDAITIGTTCGKITGAIVATTGDGSVETKVAASELTGVIFSSTESELVSGKVQYLTVVGTITGKMTVSAGTLTAGELAVMANKDSKLTVASGAVLSVPEGAKLTVNNVNDIISAVIDGKLDIVTGEVVVIGSMTVAGEISVTERGKLNVNKLLTVTGTVTVSDEKGKEGTFKLGDSAILITGEKTTTLGATGTIVGIVGMTGNSYVKAYPGSDLSAAKLAWDATTEKSLAKSTDFVINGSKYMTVYTAGTVNVYSVINAEKFEIAGVDNGVKFDANFTSTQNTGLYAASSWYTDAEMKANQKILASTGISDEVPAVYAYAAAADVFGTITQGTGLDLFIDGAKYNGEKSLTVGVHTVTYGIQTGYDGSNVAMTFNGSAVTDGKITITSDMKTFTLSVTGAVPSSGTVVIDNDKDDGMSLTDILLIVLVVLIAVMAIMVALRMMRS